MHLISAWCKSVTGGSHVALLKMKHCVLFSSHSHTVLIKVFLCTRARLSSVLSGQGFQGVPLFVFQVDLLAPGRTITLTSLPRKVRSLSNSAQVTSGTTQNIWGGKEPTLNFKAGGKICLEVFHCIHTHDIMSNLDWAFERWGTSQVAILWAAYQNTSSCIHHIGFIICYYIAYFKHITTFFFFKSSNYSLKYT